MIDPTEALRRNLVTDLNTMDPVLIPPPVWTTEELQERFVVHSFLAPFVVVTERATGRKGTLMFQHRPRVYFGWEPDPKL